MPGHRLTPRFTLRQLGSDDASAFHELRLDGFARHPREFRIAPEDEVALSPDQVAARLARDFVVGAFDSDGASAGMLVGIGGLTRFAGAKLRHKGLLWGMYVREVARGMGLGDAIVERLLAHARGDGIESVQLTVVVDNARARRVYERWGFAAYGVEPAAVKVGTGADAIYVDETLMVVRLDRQARPGV